MNSILSDIDTGLLQHILHSPFYYIVKRDLQGYYTYVNPTYAQRFSYLRQDLIGANSSLTAYEEIDIKELNHALRQVFDFPDKIVSVQVRKKKEDDSFWWINWEFSAVKDETGKVTEILSIGFETTESQIEKEKKEEYLKQQTLKLKAISNSSANIYILLDRDYKVLSFNRIASEEIYAAFQKELHEGDSFLQYIIEEKQEGFKKNFANALAGQNISIELLVPYTNGGKKWKQFRYFPVYDKENQIIGVSFNVIDIDKIKKQEQLIVANELKLKSILNSTKDINFLIDANYKVLLANKEAQKNAWEFHQKEIQEGDDFRSYITNTSAIKDFENHVQQALSGQEIFVEREIGIGQTPQKWYQYRYFPVYDNESQIIGVSLNVSDIDTQKRQKELLKERELRLSAILDSSTDINILMDLEGKVLSFNKQADINALLFLGKNMTEGMDFKEFIVPEKIESFTNHFQRVLNGEFVEGETEITYKNNTKRWLFMRYFPVYDNQNRLVAVSFNSTNITEQKLKEKKILEKNRLLEEIAHIQSHELRRPVANILGLINLINDDASSPKEVEMYLQYLLRAAQDLDNVIHNIVEKTYYDGRE
jgi:PAS domain S-box-containing protein